jgi:hypothetical protein
MLGALRYRSLRRATRKHFSAHMALFKGSEKKIAENPGKNACQAPEALNHLRINNIRVAIC